MVAVGDLIYKDIFIERSKTIENNVKRVIYILILLMAEMGCKKPYEPNIVANPGNYLVVEGVINTTDSTIIRLSRTVKLDTSIGSRPEFGATVAIVNDAGTSYPLAETGNGYYKTPPLNLSSSNKYAIRILTIENKAYQSDFVSVKNSPSIDSVYYKVVNTSNPGVQVYADTHDPANDTRYYRWDFIETWVIHSAFDSFEMVVPGSPPTIAMRPPSQQIYQCWSSAVSSNVLISSSASLSKDVIANNKITFIPSTSERISDRYSILVKQYALTKEAYNYWTLLKKNTEQLGSIFDAQPSAIVGNIHCVTVPNEPVIGYISAGSSASQRIFIDTRDLPAWLPITPYGSCMVDSALFHGPPGDVNQVQDFIFIGGQIPIAPISISGGPILGYTAGLPECVDCTLRGTNQQPAFWTDRQ